MHSSPFKLKTTRLRTVKMLYLPEFENKSSIEGLNTKITKNDKSSSKKSNPTTTHLLVQSYKEPYVQSKLLQLWNILLMNIFILLYHIMIVTFVGFIVWVVL